MEKLIKGTTAYKIFSADRRNGKLSHSYMLHFADPKNLRAALKIFAVEFFNATGALSARISNESFSDLKVYPAAGGKITADGVGALIEDSALRPVEGDKKLYIITDFDSASAIVQNKLLKTLEEPPAGVHFLLGVSSLAPVLNTVKSRVKLMEIPPFTEGEILAALLRRGENPQNAAAAASCNGILGAAENMVSGGWFAEIRQAAQSICAVKRVGDIAPLEAKYGDTKYKKELLTEIQNVYFLALSGGENPCALSKHTLIYALGELDRANRDLKFNAYFQGLLYDFMLKVVKENDRWLKLQA